MRVLVTGAAGFVGQHLCARLADQGHDLVALDNFVTSDPSARRRLEERSGCEFIEADVCEGAPISGSLDAIAHLACPASPPDYLRLPLETLRIGSDGSRFVLTLAERHACRVLLASTSEVYGDPLVRPQPESYWGNVNPIGPRSVYDESKRYAEAMFAAYRRSRDVDTAVVRIFNTYGPGLRPHDGRVVSNFIAQALHGEPLTVYGSGQQSRSFCYVDDLVEGLVRMLNATVPGPINLGNPNEISVLGLAEEILHLTGSESRLVFRPAPEDDPTNRRPSIELAQRALGWQPQVSLGEGLRRTVDWQRSLHEATATRTVPHALSSSFLHLHKESAQ